MMQTLVLATRNADKVKELRVALKDIDIALKSSVDFSDLKEVEEDRNTLEGNALKKAKYTFEATGQPALADDTGLEVDALDGRPGVYSARYAGEHASYQDNLQKLLEELAGVEEKDRGAQFRTVMAFVSANETHTFEGICRGMILTEPRGKGRFGYDPVFQPHGLDKTFAELDSETKNEISHRGKAVKKFISWFKKNHLDL